MSNKKLIISLVFCVTSIAIVASLLINNLVNAASLTLSGRVQNSTGGSIVNASVYLTEPSSSTVIYGPATTNSTGNYSLSVGAPGTYDIHFMPPGNNGYAEVVNSQVSITSNQTVNATLSTNTSTLSGTLTDNSSNPLSGITIRIYNGSNMYQTTTDSYGHYSISAPSAKYYLYMTGSVSGITTFTLIQSYASSINLTNGNLSLSLTLRIANLTVTSRNNAGQPAGSSNESVYARASSGTTYLYPGDPGTGISVVFSTGFSTNGGATGTVKTIVGASYAASGLESSSYSSSVCKTISGKVNVYDCLVLPKTVSGDESFDVPQTSPATRNFSGILTDSNNNPIPNAQVTLAKYGDTSTSVLTDSNGTYSINAEPKKYSLKVDKQDKFDGMLNFTLTQSTANPSLDLTLYDITQNLQVNNTYLTISTYDRSGTPTGQYPVNLRATSGTAYLYTGDPGESIVATGDSFYGPIGVTGTIIGAYYTALGLGSSQWVGSICEYISPSIGNDCITTPLTVTGPTNIAVPHS